MYRAGLVLLSIVMATACASASDPYTEHRSAAENRGVDFLRTLSEYGIIVDGRKTPLPILDASARGLADRCVYRTAPIHDHDPEHISIALGAGVDITTEEYNCGKTLWEVYSLLKKAHEVLQADFDRWRSGVAVCKYDAVCIAAMRDTPVNIVDSNARLIPHWKYGEYLAPYISDDLWAPWDLPGTDTFWRAGCDNSKRMLYDDNTCVEDTVTVPVGVLYDLIAEEARKLERHIEVLGEYKPR